MSDTPSSDRSRLRTPAILLLLLSTLAIAFISLLPLGIEHLAKQWVQDNGGGKVEVENIDFNPFKATLGIFNLSIEQETKQKLQLPELQLEVAWLPLLKKNFIIRGLTIKGIDIHIDQDNETINVGGITIPLGKGDNSEAILWAVQLDKLRLEESTLHYQNNQYAGSILSISELELTGLSSASPNQPGELLLTATLDGATLTTTAKITPFASPAKISGNIKLQELKLKHYSQLLAPMLSQLEGSVKLNSDLDLELAETGQYKIKQKGQLNLSELQLDDGSGRVTSKQINWQGDVIFSGAQGKSDLQVTGELTIDPTSIPASPRTTDHAIDIDGANWSGSLSLSNSAAEGKLSGFGKLAIQHLNVKHPLTTTSIQDLKIEHPKTIASWLSDQIQLTFPGKVTLAGINLETEEHSFQNDQVSWEGTIQLEQEKEQQKLTSEGQLQGEGSKLLLKQSQGSINFKSINWTGTLTTDSSTPESPITIAGKFALDAFSLANESNAKALVSFDRLEARDITGNISDINIEQLGILGLEVAEAKETPSKLALLSLAQIKLSKTRYSTTEGVEIANIVPQDLNQQIIRFPDESLNTSHLASALASLFPSEAESKETPQPSMPVHINNITLTGDSQVQFTDMTTKPAFKIGLHPTLFQIKHLSNREPDKPTDIEFEARINDNASIQLAGATTPFADQPSIDFKGQIKGLELPPLSSYTNTILGYRMESGELNAEINIKTEKGILNGDNQLTLNQVEVAAVEKKKDNKEGSKESVPLETALGMLKDKHNTIRLSLPIGGDLNNPTFDPSDAINQAIGSALKKGARTYLATALFPFGTLLTLAEIAGDAAAKVRLDPITFDPGSSELKTSHNEYLSKVAKVIDERPEINIRLCGLAAEVDRQALSEKQDKAKKTPVNDENLLELATARTKSVENYLVKTKGIEGNRLIACQAKIDPKKTEAKPRVDLLI